MIAGSPFLIGSHLLFILGLLLWFNPLTHALCVRLDQAVFYGLNGSLAQHPAWQSFWGMLNHRYETRYNLVLACCFNLWAVYAIKKPARRTQTIKHFMYFWLCFELVFCIQEYVFHSLLAIHRHSPSLVLEPSLRLSTHLHDPQIKDVSQNCFPSGHAFALLYWALFSFYLSPKRIGILGLLFALFLCLPRLFSGAHWLSDTLFALLLAAVCFGWTLRLFHRLFKMSSLRALAKQSRP